MKHLFYYLTLLQLLTRVVVEARGDTYSHILAKSARRQVENNGQRKSAQGASFATDRLSRLERILHDIRMDGHDDKTERQDILPREKIADRPLKTSQDAALRREKNQFADEAEILPSSCTLEHIRYVPSHLEQEWTKLAQNITSRDTYCERANMFIEPFRKWLDGAGDPTLASTRILRQHEQPKDEIFSIFEYTWTCGDIVKVSASAIEPLAGALRHPFGWCMDGKELHYEYLVPDVSESPGDKSGVKYLFDIGARTFDVGNGLSSDEHPLSAQKYLTDAYASRGISFDRILLWEAKPETAPAIWSSVPEHLFALVSIHELSCRRGR
jgi:hypothetical protein